MTAEIIVMFNNGIKFMLKNDSLSFRNKIKIFMDVILEIVTSSLNVI